MRLFIGIALSDDAQRALADWTHDLREEFSRLRWSLPEQWHVTLQFLGETDEAHYACVVEQARRVRAKPVDIQLTEPGFFERAGVFHIGVRATASLLALHDRTEQALLACGFEPEARAYSPHITLARRKGRSVSTDFVKLQELVLGHRIANPILFTANEFLLYQSITDPEGSRYEVRERFPLM